MGQTEKAHSSTLDMTHCQETSLALHSLIRFAVVTVTSIVKGHNLKLSV